MLILDPIGNTMVELLFVTNVFQTTRGNSPKNPLLSIAM
jgi:hypothetical protein